MKKPKICNPHSFIFPEETFHQVGELIQDNQPQTDETGRIPKTCDSGNRKFLQQLQLPQDVAEEGQIKKISPKKQTTTYKDFCNCEILGARTS